MSEIISIDLYEHDAVRLTQFSELVKTTGRPSLEGEPIYADSPWGEFHGFTYGVVIPELVSRLTNASGTCLDVLYDDCTVANASFSIDYYLENIAGTESATLPICTNNESAMLERASEWVADLRAGGYTRRREGISELGGPRPVALTTKTGRPTCAVLDAVYQQQKADAGTDVAVLVHSAGFRGQQLDMQAVLTSVNGKLPFQQFANIYVRQRKGLLRLAAMQILSNSADVTEVR